MEVLGTPCDCGSQEFLTVMLVRTQPLAIRHGFHECFYQFSAPAAPAPGK